MVKKSIIIFIFLNNILQNINSMCSNCVNGECIDNECICDEGYTNKHCTCYCLNDGYCEGNSSICKCGDKYSGPDCGDLKCPACINGECDTSTG